MKGWQALPDGTLGCHACDCHSRYAGMSGLNYWIPRRLVPDAALPPRPLVPDAALSPTSCRCASMQAGLRRNDGRGCRDGNPLCALVTGPRPGRAINSSLPPFHIQQRPPCNRAMMQGRGQQDAVSPDPAQLFNILNVARAAGGIDAAVAVAF